MASVNKVILIGNCGRDPEIRYMTDGEAVANVSIATSSSWKDKNTGEKKEETEWHRLTFYRRLAEIVGEYVKKGSTIYVEGHLKTRKWQDKDGNDRYTTEVVCDSMQLLGGKRQDDDADRSERPARQSQGKSAPAKSVADMDEDSIPF